MVESQSNREEYFSGSRLEHVLRAGRFAVTAELNPPDSGDPQKVYDAALVLSRVCDAINDSTARSRTLTYNNWAGSLFWALATDEECR